MFGCSAVEPHGRSNNIVSSLLGIRHDRSPTVLWPQHRSCHAYIAQRQELAVRVPPPSPVSSSPTPWFSGYSASTPTPSPLSQTIIFLLLGSQRTTSYLTFQVPRSCRQNSTSRRRPRREEGSNEAPASPPTSSLSPNLRTILAIRTSVSGLESTVDTDHSSTITSTLG